MFHILPHECILIIVALLSQSEPWENLRRWDPHNQYTKCWKNNLTENQIKKWNSKNDLWILPPFIWIIPLTMVSKSLSSIFNTNEVWTYIYEHEFRRGIPFKKKPEDVKGRLFNRAKEIIKKRYEPILEVHQEKVLTLQESLKEIFHNIHTIDTCISNVTPQIKDKNKIDKNIDRLHLSCIMNCGVTLPSGFVNPNGYPDPFGYGVPRRYDINRVLLWRNTYQKNGYSLINQIRDSKGSIDKIEGIITKLSY